ncbi:MAG: hypothetical protein ACRERD_17410, partial [Candidatus Binatia bacterium]
MESLAAAGGGQQAGKRGLTPWLWQALMQQGPEVTARFSTYYTQLQALPRRVRRALQRSVRLRSPLPWWEKVRERGPTAQQAPGFASSRPSTALASLALLFALGQGPAWAVTTFTVTNLDNAGTGSLRQAILDANALAGADIITFQSGLTGTITLTSGELTIADSVDIQG